MNSFCFRSSELLANLFLFCTNLKKLKADEFLGASTERFPKEGDGKKSSVTLAHDECTNFVTLFQLVQIPEHTLRKTPCPQKIALFPYFVLFPHILYIVSKQCIEHAL